MAIDPALISIWAHGRAASRGMAPPVLDRLVLMTEVGLPNEIRRHVLLAAPRRLVELGAEIVEPYIQIKAPLPAEEVASYLPGHWHVERTGTFMSIDPLVGPLPAATAGAAMAVTHDGGAYQAALITDDGRAIGRGRMAIIDRHAIFDQIAVDPDHRRKGLGRALMAVLTAQALHQGAKRGVLTATAAGRALYLRLGWVECAPWTTAQIPAPPIKP